MLKNICSAVFKSELSFVTEPDDRLGFTLKVSSDEVPVVPDFFGVMLFSAIFLPSLAKSKLSPFIYDF